MKLKFNKIFLYFSTAFTLLFSSVSQGKVLFEGYYKIEIGSLHIGYVVQRYQFNQQKKQYQSTYYIKTIIEKEQSTESLNAFATKQLKPISYQYTYTRNTAAGKKQIKIVDASTDKKNLIALVTEGFYKKNQKISPQKFIIPLKKDYILSTFFTYGVLAQGLSESTNYPYNAIAEEDASVSSGLATVVKKFKKNGKTLYKLSNDFKDKRFKSILDSKGNIYKYQSDKIKLRGTLVKKSSLATRGFPIDNKILLKLFGNIPK